jgi:hypothetical protein
LVIAIISSLFGWALSQLTIGKKLESSLAEMQLAIERNGNDAHRAQDEVAQVRQEVSAVRSDTTERITAMADMVKEVLHVASELIELAKVQNALLEEARNRASRQ